MERDTLSSLPVVDIALVCSQASEFTQVGAGPPEDTS
jgi:hypothetical protein